MSLVSLSEARQVANAFVKYELYNPCGGGPEFVDRAVGALLGQFLLADHVPLYEFGIFSSSGEAAGSILVPGSRAYPAIVEYSNSGKGLFSASMKALEKVLERGHGVSDKEISKARLYYHGPFDIVAEFEGRASFSYLRIPNYRFGLSTVALPLGLKPTVDMEYPEWRIYLDPQYDLDGFGDGKCYYAKFHKPYRYEQTCRPSGAAHGNADQEYCGADACISGCTPVAWAMLASSFSKYDEFEDMLVDSAHFRVEWGTNDHWNPADPIVDRIIWDSHGYMGTSCSGNTYGDRRVDAGWLFRRYGYVCSFGDRPVGAPFFASVLDGGFTLMGSGRSEWNIGTGDIEGHSFVVYGYDTRWFADKLLICMGWGTGYDDRWISAGAVSDLEATYLSSIRLLDDEQDIDESRTETYPPFYQRR
ncbi:hypothetical protein LB543_01260 [Mesorhizobium sp. ESP7-2]|uniref:hypothetical protein n=1 Tax=Mesorhizobium sp. ESP7-2 TaxID=2876622 RepID=UPI001CD01D8F|nr:hypothetical protein [Mesorhizobium sp. ESP7-2]MBZ9705357.1 hypothetical protein [Mesorhizobium sp. ESP7-2]